MEDSNQNISMQNFNSYSISSDDTLKKLSSTNQGLSSDEARKRLDLYGKNALKEPKKQSIISVFFTQFADFMVIILIIAAVISFIVSAIEGSTDYADTLIIMAIIILNAIISTYQETKARHSIEALKKLSSPVARVMRDNKLITINTSELVVGDIIHLHSGDFVPADCRLIECVNLCIDEASLTGESHPVQKDCSAILSDDSVISNHVNMCYSSSIVLEGHGIGVVVATGSDTQVGHIAKMIVEDAAPLTPLQKKLDKTGKILGISAVIICVFIFFIGILKGFELFDMFITSVSLAVASIPEGLSIIVTIMLSLGVTRIARKNAIVRKLPAVETLGSATYICSDKTGTLTQNKMTVTDYYCTGNHSNPANFLAQLACLCNNSVYNAPSSNTNVNKNNSHKTLPGFLADKTNTDDKKSLAVTGEPTEVALMNFAINQNLDIQNTKTRYKRVYEIPFNSKKKMMTTVHCIAPNTYRCITKGAFDFLIDKCQLDSYEKKDLINKNAVMTSKALRVIAFAYKDINYMPSKNNLSSLTDNLTFAGMLGMIDPPRPEVKDAVDSCKHAGITPVMITGDHPITACAIACELGIINSDSHHLTQFNNSNFIQNNCITGEQLNKMSDSDLNSIVMNYQVFARVSPAHKVRIVKALQSNNQVVAMTGDGVNDAPALKCADIGCSMGLGGTEVAKNASDIILADDNFATIVEAVREGRGIYDNIKKSIHFLLSSNIGEIITILIAILFGLPTPLLAVQLLWINLVTDSLPAIALGVEPASKTIMHKKPVSQSSSLFTRDLTVRIIFEGIMIGSLSLIAFILGYRILPVAPADKLLTGRTMAFAVLGMSQIFHSFNMKSEQSLSTINIFNNPKLIFAFIICMILQVSVISLEIFASLFEVIKLNTIQWILVVLLSFLPIVIVETQKKFRIS